MNLMKRRKQAKMKRLKMMKSLSMRMRRRETTMIWKL
jgi:hypothetical protein